MSVDYEGVMKLRRLEKSASRLVRIESGFYDELTSFVSRENDSLATSMPTALSCRNPFPETRGFGSSSGEISRAMPAAIMASVQGGATP